MNESDDPHRQQQIANRQRSRVLGYCLGGMVVLVYLITLVRLVRP